MNKRLLSLFSLIIFLASINIVSAQIRTKSSPTVDDWLGEYSYTYKETRTQGGWVPIIDYTITISKEDDRLIARFKADGYMSNDDFIYTAKIVGNRLNMYFLRDPNSTNPDLDRTLAKMRPKTSSSLLRTMVRGRTEYRFVSKDYFGNLRPVFKKKLSQ
jgi:hypothetical protein